MPEIDYTFTRRIYGREVLRFYLMPFILLHDALGWGREYTKTTNGERRGEG